MKKYVVTILTWNRPQKVIETLSSFYTYNGENHDIIVLDNGSSERTDFSEFKDIETIYNKENMGVFLGTLQLWGLAIDRGYDYILNLQDDFPSIHSIPFKELICWVDKRRYIGFVRLNDKPDANKNTVTRKPIVYREAEYIGRGTCIQRYTHHATFNPCLLRSKLAQKTIDRVRSKSHKKRSHKKIPSERTYMYTFEDTNFIAAKMIPPAFQTYPSRKRFEGWRK